MNILKFVRKLFKETPEQNVYPKIDKLEKDGDCLFIQSSEGLTEDELLQIISKELLN